MSKIRVDKRDKYRVLLTETLPYEVPIIFSNEGLYNHVKSDNCETSKFILELFRYDKYTEPYNFRINKNDTSQRLLTVCHPSIQIKVAEFYYQFDALITELCSRSPITLRAPSKVASMYYEKDFVKYERVEKNSGVEVDSDSSLKSTTYCSSYFTYKKYNFMYKYYDSYESHRIEKRFTHLLRFDISKCFHNIYTPTLAWAVKGKDFSKIHSNKKSFESEFERIMRASNELESSGIIVGPEFSRIYAEIILQKLDILIIESVKLKLNLDFGRDYTIRRYVDDYFLYTRRKEHLSSIFRVIKEELETYKLFLNEAKTKVEDLPFITGLTIAKMDCKDLVEETFSKIITTSDTKERELNFPTSPDRKVRLFIKNLKRIVKKNQVGYQSLSGYVLSEIRRKLYSIIHDHKLLRNSSENRESHLVNLVIFTIEACFFIYNMDIRVRTTYIITQIIINLSNISTQFSPEFEDTVKKKIYDESSVLLSKMQESDKARSIEAMNLLIAYSTNSERYPISEDYLLGLFGLELSESGKDIVIKENLNNHFGFFQVMTLLYYSKSNSKLVLKFLKKQVQSILENTFDVRKNTEAILVFLDSMGCPYFDEAFKKTLISLLYLNLYEKEIPSTHLNSLYAGLTRQYWHTNWDTADLEEILIKKELRSPY